MRSGSESGGLRVETLTKSHQHADCTRNRAGAHLVWGVLRRMAVVRRRNL